MNRYFATVSSLVSLIAMFVSTGCTKCESDPTTSSDPAVVQQQAATQNGLTILTGSENETLEPIVSEWATTNKVAVSIRYQGSVDIMRCISRGKACEFDAVWPAQSLWIELGDTGRVLKDAKSIMRSPIVLGMRKSVAVRLGWTGSKPVSFHDILAEAQKGIFKMSMTSATQSNSGSSAYLGIWYAMSGNPDMLQGSHLVDGKTRESVRTFLSNVNRGSGSSGWLKEALVQDPDKFGSMFNYESMVIEANAGWSKKGQHVQGLVERGQEPLCAVYPSDGMTVADSPLALINRGDDKKQQLFASLQSFLLSRPIQDRIQATGRRTGLLGMTMEGADPKIWNKDWCIDTARELSPVPTPNAEVIKQALSAYQTDLRKPSLTVWILDKSGSMSGEGIDGLHQAMRVLHDPVVAEQNLLQIGPKDVTIVITFSGSVEDVWKIEGNNPGMVQDLLNKTQGISSGGGTDLYAALIRALNELKPYNDSKTLWNYLPAINVMTDGRSETGNRDAFFKLRDELPFGRDIPINAIPFGAAEDDQLVELTKKSAGKFFVKTTDLPKTLRDAKGYN